MTTLQIFAFLAVLNSFGVDAQTVAQIQAILMPTPIVQTAPIQVIQSPIVENQPVYFGSTAPVQEPAPVVSPQPVAETPVVVLPAVEPLYLTNAELLEGTLRVFTNKPVTASVSEGTLGDREQRDGENLGYINVNGTRVPLHTYEWPITGLRPQDGNAHFFVVTLTDSDGQSKARSVYY